MRRGQGSMILDTWAIIAWLEGEAAGARVGDVLDDCAAGRTGLAMSCVNAAEIWYVIARRVSPSEADRTVKDLEGIGIEMVEADIALAREAGRFKSSARISLADAFAAALARMRGAPLLTGDRGFEQLGKEIRVEWLEPGRDPKR